MTVVLAVGGQGGFFSRRHKNKSFAADSGTDIYGFGMFVLSIGPKHRLALNGQGHGRDCQSYKDPAHDSLSNGCWIDGLESDFPDNTHTPV